MSYREYTIAVDESLKDALIPILMKEGCLGVIELDREIKAFFPEAADSASITNALTLLNILLEKSGQPNALTFSQTRIPEQDWNATWKKGFTPLDVGSRFTILPPWEEPRPGRINLVIDPGMAFGTGHHETTRSCLVLLEQYSGNVDLNRMLDVGTGTGILAIAAKAMGYRDVVAVDTDILAVEAARGNSALNKIPAFDIREGGIESAAGTYDIITANILANVLVRLAPALAGRLHERGYAILSGILAGQEDEVVQALSDAGLKLVQRYPDGKWMSLVVRR